MLDWRKLSWAEFCAWLQGKSVVEDREDCASDCQVLVFSDGTMARMESRHSDAYESDPGHLEPPTVEVTSS
jgi:hypothetical protein